MTKSRGLRHIERHGLFAATGGVMTPEYRAWKAMVERCGNPRCRSFKNYGARGIRVAPEWRVSFAAFMAEVGPRPTPQHSLDRIDNERGYEPGNVRWVTRDVQNRNRRGLRLLTWRGETLCVQAWADRLGVSEKRLRGRLSRGWSVERTLGEAGR